MEGYIALLGLVLSFFFAGSEAAYTSFNKLRLEVWHRQGKPLANTATAFVQKPENFFSTILVGNNIANILYTTFATVLLVLYLDETLAWLVITFAVLLLGEIFPKIVFRSMANKIILQVLVVVRFFHILFQPLIVVFNKLIDITLNLFGVRHESMADYFSRDEIEILLHEGASHSTNHTDEQKYITRVLDFYESRVREAMTPRTEVVAAEEHVSCDEIQNLFIQSGTNHILIFSESLDNIKGIIFTYDMLTPSDRIQDLVHPVEYVPENKSCLLLLREFQKKNMSIAVVVDEYGGTAGLVTTDDLIEELFGHFLEDGQAAPNIRALNDHTWLMDARIELDELADIVDCRFPEGDYETVAGLVLNKSGHIPGSGEIINFDNFKIVINRVTRKKIDQVKLIKKK